MAEEIKIMHKDCHKHSECLVCTTECWQTIGCRHSQEDRYICAPSGHGTIAAVMDGHGGANAAHTIMEHIVADFSREFRRLSASVSRNWFTKNEERTLIRRTVARQVKRCRDIEAGTTLSLVYTHAIQSSVSDVPVMRTHIATLGDSPACILKGGRVTVMSIHSARHHIKDINRINEKISRISKILHNGERKLTARELPHLDAKAFRGYVYLRRGSLDSYGIAMTRAIGDADFGDLLLRTPDIRTYDLPADSIILLATDGIEDDGLPDPVRDQCNWILDRIKRGDTLSTIGGRISPFHDNTTMIAVKFSEVTSKWR